MGIKRNYGIDLLRIILMLMVCVQHILGQGGILGAYPEGSIGYTIMQLLYIVCVGAVDGFALITGYMSVNKPQRYEKLVGMWFQAFFYSFVLTIVFIITGISSDVKIIGFMKNALPLTFGKYWYFSAYFVLLLAIPILNKFLFSIDVIIARKIFVISIVIFTTVGLITDCFRTEYGYSAIWLIYLYCLGVLAKRIELFERKRLWHLIVIWCVCVLFTLGSILVTGVRKLINYNSPTILLSAIVLVVVFNRFNFKGRIISKISPLVFAVYLFQLNSVIWHEILEDAFVFVTEHNLLIAVLFVVLSSAGLFVVALIVEVIRRFIAKVLRLDKLSKVIVKGIDKLAIKASLLLK